MKSIFRSRTFWLNVATGLSVLLAMPELTAILGPDALKYVVLIQSAANVILRVLTSQPVSVLPKPEGDIA